MLDPCSSRGTRPHAVARRTPFPDATTRCRCPTATSSRATPITPPFPDGMRDGHLRPRLLLGRRAQVLADRPACTPPPSATPAASRRTPPTRRSARGRTGHTEVVLVVFDPSRSAYDELLRDLLGEPRPDPGHAPGQRRRHAVPLGIYAVDDRAAGGRRGVARRRTRQSWTRRRLRRDHHRDRRARRPSTTPRTTTSSTWPRTPTATAASAAPASAARSASPPPTEPLLGRAARRDRPGPLGCWRPPAPTPRTRRRRRRRRGTERPDR